MPQPAPADSRTCFAAGRDATGAASAAPCRPAVLSLDLSCFRNHRATRVTPGAAPVVLTGPNGAGKTNMLEALSFLAPGRGLRRARLAEIGLREPGDAAGRGWAVSAAVALGDETVRIGTGSDPAAPAEEAGERRVLRIDGAPARSQQALAERLAVVWLTPDHDRLFADGAGGRRRFLDRLVASYDPAHVGRVSAYEHGLRERSRLLQAGRWDARWLDALEERLAAEGIAIVDARAHLIARLGAALTDGVGLFLAPRLSASGELEGWLDAAPALAAEERFRGALAADRGRDTAHGGAAVGPHRSDLVAHHPLTGAEARQCSTGEQKAMVIAIVLAHARMIAADRGQPPLLLLDEVAAHLDSDRRRALFDQLVALNTQAWMTGADRALFDGLAKRARFCTVRDGQVTLD